MEKTNDEEVHITKKITFSWQFWVLGAILIAIFAANSYYDNKPALEPRDYQIEIVSAPQDSIIIYKVYSGDKLIGRGSSSSLDSLVEKDNQ